MGMLDDAIREHLELKKRSGAPDQEVQRLESEVFGPPRSAAVPQPEPEPEPEPALEPEPAPAAVEPPAPEPAAMAEPAPAPPAPPLQREPEPWLEEDPDEVPFHEALDHRNAAAAQPTSEFTPEEAAEAAGVAPADAAAPDGAAEDVLEETPDFLQETPEHDRLWFEQRPPRDFDFDQ
jgi:hypothetical protein